MPNLLKRLGLALSLLLGIVAAILVVTVQVMIVEWFLGH